MFERRLKWLAIAMAAVGLVIILRLFELQVLSAGQYAAWADNQLTQPVRYVRAARGSILDRNGRPLVTDEPASDISVHYMVLSGASERYLRAFAREKRRRGAAPDGVGERELAAELRHDIPETWRRLEQLTGRAAAEFLELGDALRRRVERIRAGVSERTGLTQPVVEEYAFHPVISGIDDELAIRARLELDARRFPWIDVVPNARRVAHDADSLAHLLGRLGAASPQRIDDDPLGDEELLRLRPGDLCGVSGVERAADAPLRGRRGRKMVDLEGQVIDHVNPQPGRNVSLTIDLDLQKRVLDILKEGVDDSEHPAGGAAVVIDVQSRDVLALVSYPTYAFDRYSADYDRLARDTRWLPLRARAVAEHYPPGSTCKAVTLVGGLSDKVIAPTARIHCRGHYLPNQPNQFRCWIYNREHTTHDATDNAEGQDAESAVRNSCNIYFFTVGDRLGPARLCAWFDQFGLGRVQGTGLIEESPGIDPTAEWLRANQNRGFEPADAWNFSIGQGEVTATPLQAANIAATAASGRWEAVKLIRDEFGEPLRVAVEPARSFDESAMRVLRTGMWRVVNERGGTAHYAKLDLRDWELCGKTGSAQTVPRVVASTFTLEWPDGRREAVVAGTEDEALERLAEPRPKVVGRRAAERYPPWSPGEPLPSHAWFIGYTQAAGTPRGAAPKGRSFAIAVLIEFGGGGGRVAGPVAKRIAEELHSARVFGAATLSRVANSE